jgi:hypothetical protein
LYIDAIHGAIIILLFLSLVSMTSKNIDNCFILILVFSKVTIHVVLGVGCVLGVVSVIKSKSLRLMNVGC